MRADNLADNKEQTNAAFNALINRLNEIGDRYPKETIYRSNRQAGIDLQQLNIPEGNIILRERVLLNKLKKFSMDQVHHSWYRK
jgi:hypothetical protein